MDRNARKDQGAGPAAFIQIGKGQGQNHCQQGPGKGGGRHGTGTGQKQNPRRGSGAGPGGNTDDVRGGQGIAENGLINKPRRPQSKAADDRHKGSAAPERPENAPLRLVTPEQHGKRQRVFPDK